MVRKFLLRLFLLMSLSVAEAESLTGKYIMVKDVSVLNFVSDDDDSQIDLVQNIIQHRVFRVSKACGTALELEEASGLIPRNGVMTVKDAVTYWSKQIKDNPEIAENYAQRAIAYHHLGKEKLAASQGGMTQAAAMPRELDLAIDDMGMAIRLQSTKAYWWIMLASIRHTRKEMNLAIDDITAAIDLEPNGAYLYLCRGKLYLEIDQFDQAIRDFTKVIDLVPQSSQALRYRCEAWVSRNEFDKAIADCSKALEIEPANSELYQIRGAAWHNKNDYEKAISDYNRAIDIDPTASLYYNRGLVCFQTRKYDQAKGDLIKAVELDPKEVKTLTLLSILYSTCPVDRCRNGKKAAEYAKVLVAGNDDWFNHEIFAAALAESGDFDGAVKEQAKAIDLQKTDSQARKEVIARSAKCLELYKSKRPYRNE